MTEAIKEAMRNTAFGIKRMTVTICCVAAITFIDYTHVIKTSEMGANSITAMCLIAALGGVDVWKNGLFKKGA